MPGRRKRASAADVMEYLGPIYGPVEWEPRYNPAEELVYTILSQHTSDINSGRAFGNLMSRFENLDAIADAPQEEIEEAIRSGGLAQQKSARIKEVLNMVRDELGSFDLSFPGRNGAGRGEDVAEASARDRSQDGGHNSLLLSGDAGYAGRYAHSQGFPAAEADRSQGVGGQGARHSGV